ncbi:MAG: endonuclease/exonuclease/phosphatase family protein [Gemmatimonadota bacterium]|jgi:endonuclease/exonuclease/phosphatase family metal-dependent hydrolase
MNIRLRTRAFATAAFALTSLWACSDAPEPVAPPLDLPRADSYWSNQGNQNPFKVYTQNAYLGGDTGPLFTLDFSDIPAVIAATTTFWNQVQASDIPERAAAIVDEIEAYRPHVAALQEVVRFAVVDARTGGLLGGADILGSIQAEIATRGLPYEVVRVQQNTNITLPLSADAAGLTTALNVTDQDAVLRRTDVVVTSSDKGTFDARVILPTGDEFTRGWIRLTTQWHGVSYNVVATHLEVQAFADKQADQLDELMGVMSDLDGVTILAGDLNSDAAGQPGDPSWTATYGDLRDAGFADAWEDSGQPAYDPGYTCCQATDLLNGSSQLNQRLDLVLVRGAGINTEGRLPGSSQVEIVGDRQADRTPTDGLWPADHAGLMAGLALPSGLNATSN